MNCLTLFDRGRALGALALAAGLAGCMSDPGRGSGSLGESGADAGSPAPCGAHTAEVRTVHGDSFASASFEETDTHLRVTVTSTAAGVHLKALYLEASAEVITSGAYVNPLEFAYQAHLSAPYPTSHTLEVPLVELGVTADACGSAHVALHVVGKILDGDGAVVGKKVGWATGDQDCPANKDDIDSCSWFTLALCCGEPDAPDAGAGGPTCGDGACEDGEVCDADCGTDDCDHECGDGMCGVGEDCPEDCADDACDDAHECCDDACEPDKPEEAAGCTRTLGYWKTTTSTPPRPACSPTGRRRTTRTTSCAASGCSTSCAGRARGTRG